MTIVERLKKVESLAREVMKDRNVYHHGLRDDSTSCTHCNVGLEIYKKECQNPDCCAYQLRELLKQGD